VSAVDLEDAFRIGLLRRAAGEAVGDLVGAFGGFLIDGFAFDDEGLTDVGEVEIAVEFNGCPDLTGFDAAVVRRGELDEVGLLAIFEVQGDVLFEGRLVGFDREVVMGGPLDPRYPASLRWVNSASAVMFLSLISIASSSGMTVAISLVCLTASASPATGRVPTFFGCSRSWCGDRRRS
jgi:hypothetical protein